MSKYYLEIKLESDLCVSDGGVYNSVVDTDACYDKNGLPYIPGKRIKGVLRECAEDLEDWKLLDKGTAERLFGMPGEASGRAIVSIHNAVLENSDKYLEEIQRNTGHPIYHAQNVVECFSYLRTQTSVSYDKGVAVEGLRTTRVMNKGLCFRAPFSIDGDDREKVFKELKRVALSCRYIGLNRTRGLGQVSIKVAEEDNSPKKEARETIAADCRCLEYSILLKDPVICKSVRAGEASTLDYIEGSKLLGLIAGCAKRSGKNVAELFANGNLHVSNAYISEGESRGEEVSASLYSIKNNKSEYVDKARTAVKQDGVQLNRMKHCYSVMVDGKLKKLFVNLEEHYHHRRPEDKGIGRATGGEDSEMFQMEAISSGQEFKGLIYGAPEAIQTVYGLLTERSEYSIGYAASSEYGRVQLTVKETETKEQKLKGKKILVKLLSPAIIYSEKAFYSTSAADLIAEAESCLGIQADAVESVEKFLSYVPTGGYNVTWNKRKPTVMAFDKGTVLIFHMKKETEVILPQIPFLGERTAEGYGEFSGEAVTESTGGNLSFYQETERKKCADMKETGELAQKIIPLLFTELLMKEAVEHAGTHDIIAKWGVDGARPTVSNMTGMCSECRTIDEVRAQVAARYEKVSDKKKEKKKIADDILDGVTERYPKIKKAFAEEYGIPRNWELPDEEALRLRFLAEVLKQYKYRIRQAKEE